MLRCRLSKRKRKDVGFWIVIIFERSGQGHQHSVVIPINGLRILVRMWDRKEMEVSTSSIHTHTPFLREKPQPLVLILSEPHPPMYFPSRLSRCESSVHTNLWDEVSPSRSEKWHSSKKKKKIYTTMLLNKRLHLPTQKTIMTKRKTWLENNRRRMNDHLTKCGHPTTSVLLLVRQVFPS